MAKLGRPKRVTSTFRIIVENGRENPAYVRLLDPAWQKEKVSIRSGHMDDPTSGHLPNVNEYLQEAMAQQPDGALTVRQLFLWSPALPSHAELFTLHVYEDVGKASFDDLRLLFFLVDPYQVRPDVIEWKEIDLVLKPTTRISFMMPAYNKMLLDFNYLAKG
jgi:hypothetical protein